MLIEMLTDRGKFGSTIWEIDRRLKEIGDKGRKAMRHPKS